LDLQLDDRRTNLAESIRNMASAGNDPHKSFQNLKSWRKRGLSLQDETDIEFKTTDSMVQQLQQSQ
jgi:hypothetical protein